MLWRADSRFPSRLVLLGLTADCAPNLARPIAFTLASVGKEETLRGTINCWRHLAALALGVVFAIAAIFPVLAGEEPPDLCGRWALVEVMPGIADLPLVGHVELTTISGLFVDVKQEGTKLLLKETYAFVDVRMTPPMVATTVPEAFVACMPSAVQTGMLQPSGACWAFAGGTLTQVRGAHLENPADDALPTSPDDPRVFDEDGDGQPGLTVHVRLAGVVSGNTYVVQRLILALHGSVDDANTVVGTVDWKSEENVVAASNPLLKMSYTYGPDRASTGNVFVMRRIDGSWTAQTLRDHLPELLFVASAEAVPGPP